MEAQLGIHKILALNPLSEVDLLNQKIISPLTAMLIARNVVCVMDWAVPPPP